jgi:uncharacterized ferritin-like protein (DUF455 family)
LTQSIFEAARHCLLCNRVDEKLELTDWTADEWEAGQLVAEDRTPCDTLIEAGRPQRPELVHPSRLPGRGLGSERGRLALIHAIAHIEFNAINLAWDAVQRFRGLPRE